MESHEFVQFFNLKITFFARTTKTAFIAGH